MGDLENVSDTIESGRYLQIHPKKSTFLVVFRVSLNHETALKTILR